MLVDPLSKVELSFHKDDHRIRKEFQKQPGKIPKLTENEEIEYQFYLPGSYRPSQKNPSVFQKEIIRFHCMKSSPKKNLSIFDATNEFIRFNNEKPRTKSDGPVWPGWPFMPRNDNAIGMVSESMNLPPHMMTPGAQTIIWPQKRSKLSCQENSENAP